MEFNKKWKHYRDNKYHIISFNINTEEWQFFNEFSGTFVSWKNFPSQYGMTKTKAIEILNQIKELAEMPANKYNTQHKIIRLSSVTYNSEDVGMINGDDYLKLKSTVCYLDKTFRDNIHVVVAEDEDSEKRTSTFYFYLDEELTWFLELKTNIDYSLVSNITTLDDIKELL